MSIFWSTCLTNWQWLFSIGNWPIIARAQILVLRWGPEVVSSHGRLKEDIYYFEFPTPALGNLLIKQGVLSFQCYLLMKSVVDVK